MLAASRLAGGMGGAISPSIVARLLGHAAHEATEPAPRRPRPRSTPGRLVGQSQENISCLGLTRFVTLVIIETMKELNYIGQELIDYAEHTAEFTAQRGLLDELFPFIYLASKRMSLRAVCRWLDDAHRIKISVNAVSKAMRNQEEYWERLAEEVIPAVRTFADAHDGSPLNVLDNKDYFESLEVAAPIISAGDGEDIAKEYDQVVEAAAVIRNRWFSLPKEARNQCWRHFAGEFAPSETDGDEEGVTK